ncbi:MAG TPA: sigma factor-like helix-turn-helix DNA-binding protein [Polyangiaceae bacterium]|nr:sigma factor-like helix-turn-helix DNA-binding protein [Polyangiaceae bacterium]
MIENALTQDPRALNEEQAAALGLWLARPAPAWTAEQREAIEHWAKHKLGKVPGAEWSVPARRVAVRYLVHLRGAQLSALCVRRAAGVARGEVRQAQLAHGFSDDDLEQLWHGFRSHLHDFKHDIMQEQLRYLYDKGFATFDPAQASFRGFIDMGFGRAAAHLARREIRHRLLEGQVERSPAETVQASPANEPEDLEQLLQRLSPTYREAIELSLRLTIPEAAAAAKCTVAAFYVRLCRAKKELERIAAQEENR